MLRISDCGLRIGPKRRDSAIRNRQSAIRFDRMNATPRIPVPVNEPVLSYAPGTPERAELKRTVKRSEERTSELQSRLHLVCRLLLEKKKKKKTHHTDKRQIVTQRTNSVETLATR